MRQFAYSRCSTEGQHTDNQFLAIENAGYDIEKHRQVAETVSGGVPAFQRLVFAKLVDRLEKGDELIVAKIDRLGRDNIDVQQTILKLSERGVKVTSLDLPAKDLTSSEGKLILQMFSAFAEFERSRIAERTREGQARARKEGKQIGRPQATGTTSAVQSLKAKKLSQSRVAKELGVSIPTVKRHWNKTLEVG
ncbi:MAG: resolvase [SAR86 cluster bacterium]|uniref:Resolvase n=1 Tax=SAR86 cluster bacterium TaxID=2030880 RepID=A0A2A4MQJ2_9GAMM|nr:MAG: resolvase [SAR86 cluster bacterium]